MTASAAPFRLPLDAIALVGYLPKPNRDRK
jgi:hypothetical protein